MEEKSFWIENFKTEKYKKLENNINTEVAIIGGGITGISSAYYLSKKGLEVTLLEKDFISSKTTGHTTGKITSEHGLFYMYLLESKGVSFVEKYLKANNQAIKNIEEIINTENINCDFEKKDAYVFTTNPQKSKSIEDEVNICKKLGVEAQFEKTIELPINIQGAIKFKNQAQFNPIKYINGMCESIEKNGGEIYENSQVIKYKKNNGKIELSVKSGENIFKVIADKVIVATRYPIFDFPGIYFIKNYQELDYVICAEVDNNIDNLGMYLSADSPTLSFRTVLKDNKRLLLLAGNGSRTGNNERNRILFS